MEVITHSLSITGSDKTALRIAPGHRIPAHAAYLGVLHGSHQSSECDCDECLDAYDEDDRGQDRDDLDDDGCPVA